MSDFATIEQAIEDIKNGKMLVVVDDEDRENEGDLIVAAEKMTPEHMNFMATHARGLICTPIIGSPLNIETDILGKYALKLLGGENTAEMSAGLTREFLLQHGF